MKILFIHQNFPGQYKHLAPKLVEQGHNCVALTLRVKKPMTWNGVRVLPYKLPKIGRRSTHAWVQDFDSKVTRAEACYHAAKHLRDLGFHPDLILAHHGWGEPMFLRDVWPNARMALYCELYHASDADHANFDPEFQPQNPDVIPLRMRLKNVNNHLHFPFAQAGISPTQFQADTFPLEFRDKITVCHDGIDTELVKPNPEAELEIDDLTLTRKDEVITFINRNLEPYRGYHIFMRALPRLLKERPNARVLMLGGDEVSYGAAAPKGKTWKQVYIDEVRADISDEDWARVHFLGRVPYEKYLSLIQISRVHVYLTYPFVLSWSLMESMSAECAIVASDTAPVKEVIKHGETGHLVDFFDTDALIEQVGALLDNPEQRQKLGANARKLIQNNYDLQKICLPQLVKWVDKVAKLPL